MYFYRTRIVCHWIMFHFVRSFVYRAFVSDIVRSFRVSCVCIFRIVRSFHFVYRAFVSCIFCIARSFHLLRIVNLYDPGSVLVVDNNLCSFLIYDVSANLTRNDGFAFSQLNNVKYLHFAVSCFRFHASTFIFCALVLHRLNVQTQKHVVIASGFQSNLNLKKKRANVLSVLLASHWCLSHTNIWIIRPQWHHIKCPLEY